jgi:outer membrane murein-binding lipoprotein Lpp
MKKIMLTALATVTFSSLMLAGCKNEEPKQPPVKETTTKAIQAAADKAHAVIDKAATTSQTLAEKAEEIKDTARKAANDMSATIQKNNAQNMEKAPEPQPAPPK